MLHSRGNCDEPRIVIEGEVHPPPAGTGRRAGWPGRQPDCDGFRSCSAAWAGRTAPIPRARSRTPRARRPRAGRRNSVRPAGSERRGGCCRAGGPAARSGSRTVTVSEVVAQRELVERRRFLVLDLELVELAVRDRTVEILFGLQGPIVEEVAAGQARDEAIVEKALLDEDLEV